MSESTGKMPLLCLEALSVVYGDGQKSVRAVDGVSFSIEPGEILALVGESGSGKSSVALALTRLLPESASVSGKILFEKAELLSMTEKNLRKIRGGRISYVFQDPATALNPVLTVGEQLLEAIRIHRLLQGEPARREAMDWLKRVGIQNTEDRFRAYPHEFSGGMQQRVCLAMALATQPSLLVADEPTTALDVTIQVQILRLMRDLQRSLALSVLLISHDLTVVERLARRVGIMHQGKLVECGPTQRVLQSPQHPYARQLVGSRPVIALTSQEKHG